MARLSGLELQRPNAADEYYNLLAEGFQAGHLSLNKEVPPEFTSLANPYDPAAHLRFQRPPYRMADLSYYNGKFYLYWGATPVMILYWPYVTLTGHYLNDRQAVTIFCALGFLVSVGLLRGLWRRYFAEVDVVVVAACALALGLATGLPMLLWRSSVHEVAVSCTYLLTMLALAALWRALHEPERRWPWVVAASVAYGLAVGARPTVLFGALILLAPVAQAWRERRQVWPALLAAMGPILLIGLGLMLYNDLRFGSPWEFGTHYQLNEEQMAGRQFFSLAYFWFNFRVYFLEPARWSIHFPFVHDANVPPFPAGYVLVRNPFGILTNIPVVWLALAAPLAWRGRSVETGALRWFATAAALLFGACALTLEFYESANARYQVDFVPALMWLAVLGILGVERTLADRPQVRRNASRCGWGLLLGFSVAFNLLATVDRYVESHWNLALELAQAGRLPEAIAQYEQALRIEPHNAEAHSLLAFTLAEAGKLPEANQQFEEAVRLKPDFAEAHNNLAAALAQTGRLQEAIAHYQQALRLQPDDAEVHYDLAGVLERTGKTPEAISQFEQALRIKPDDAKIQVNLAWLLATHAPSEGGDPVRAVTLAERACELTTNSTYAYLDTLAAAHAATGRFDDAIVIARKALDHARAANRPQAAQDISLRLLLYRTGHAYRQSIAALPAQNQ